MNQSIKTIYECGKCGAQSLKWQGRCGECGAWGSLSQIAEQGSQSVLNKNILPGRPGKVVNFQEIESKDVSRIKTGLGEFDQVLGGGIVPGSLVLIGGEPGIGKSTLVLQLVSQISRSSSLPTLYVSGEESAEQIKMRLDRLSLKSQNIQFLGETDIGVIGATIEKHRPNLVIIDSIQTMYSPEIPSEAGSVSQVRVCTVKLLEQAKKNNIPVFIIGHVTKEGMVAGPKTLEHLVDTVLYLEGDRYHHFRILRTVKNRFGSTNEVGIFEMRDKGLMEIKNPSEVFLRERLEEISGSVITVVMEGNRAFLVEIQALVSQTYYGYPQKKSSGFDLNRLELLIAVLSKRCGLNLSGQDILINVAGGIKMTEPAADLAVSLAIASAFHNKVIDPKLVVVGEVGLGGEIRAVSQIEKRVIEAEKLGFNKILIPAVKTAVSSKKVKIMPAKSLKEAIKLVIGNE